LIIADVCTGVLIQLSAGKGEDARTRMPLIQVVRGRLEEQQTDGSFMYCT
jgi:hypothetical protein